MGVTAKYGFTAIAGVEIHYYVIGYFSCIVLYRLITFQKHKYCMIIKGKTRSLQYTASWEGWLYTRLE